MKVQYYSNLTTENNQEEKKDFPKCQYHAYYCKKGWYDSKTDTYLHSCNGFHCPRHGINTRRNLYRDALAQLPESNFLSTQVFHFNKTNASEITTKIKQSIERAIETACPGAKCFFVPHYKWHDDHLHILIAHDLPIRQDVIQKKLGHGSSLVQKLCPEGKLMEWRVIDDPSGWLWYVLRCSEEGKPIGFRPHGKGWRNYYGFSSLKRRKRYKKKTLSLVDELYQNDTENGFNPQGSIRNTFEPKRSYGSLGMGEHANQVGMDEPLGPSERLTITPRGFLEDHLFDTS